MVAIPILINPISDLEVAVNAEPTSLSLFENFDDPFTTGLVARFELSHETFPNQGVTEVLLFDQAGEGAPLTVENFTNYVEDGDYVNSIIHRSVTDFVVQGGGFIVEGLEEALAANDPASAISNVPTDDPIPNEFSADRSNVAGTIAMAKLGGDPDSATSQWFFNLSDNSANLDNQNGGFTVFGEVISAEDFEVVEAIADVPTFNASNFFTEGAFTDLPILTDLDNPVITDEDDFIRYDNITVSQQPELQFTLINNSNPSLVTATITEGELVLDYLENETGTAEITIQATNLVGEIVEDTFAVVVEDISTNPLTSTDDSVTVEENNSININFLGNDTFVNNLSAIAITATPNNGTVEIDNNGTPNDPTDDRFVYTPNVNFSGSDSFSYTLTDEQGNSSTANVSVTINAIPPDLDAILLFGSLNDDNIALSGSNNQGIIFSGAGEDTVDNQNSQQGSTRLYGGEGNDRLLVSSSDRAFGGGGNDTIDASLGSGDNRLYGGEGDDLLIVGSNDRAIAGDGNDTLTLTTGGDNLLSGGIGNDNFLIEADQVPESVNIINDFTKGEDQITFTGFPDLDFNRLTLTASADGSDTLLSLDSLNNDLIRLQGVSVDILSEADFNFTA